MRKYPRIIFTVVFAVYCLIDAVGINAQSAESNSYFEKGIEAYNRSEYHQAIECFSKCKELDEKELDPNSSRLFYSDPWIGHCYYKLGDLDKAKEYDHDYYYVEPIDRRRTVESDRENDLYEQAFQNFDLDMALFHALRCKELEEKELGKENLSYVGSCYAISELYYYMKDFNSMLEYCNEGLIQLKKMGIDNGNSFYQLMKNRIEAKLRLGRLLEIDEDLNELKSISVFFEDGIDAQLASADIKILESSVLIAKREDLDYAVALASEAFNILETCYGQNEDVTLMMTECLNIIDMTGNDKLQIELIKSILSKDLVTDDRGLFLSYLADFTLDIPERVRLHREADTLLGESPYVNEYYGNKLRLADLEAYNNNYDNAIEIYKQVCDYFKSSHSGTPAHKAALRKLGDIYYAISQYSKANEAYEELMNILRRNKDDPEYILTLFKWIPVSLYYFLNDNSPEASAKGYEMATEMQNALTSNINLHIFLANGYSIDYIAYQMLPFFEMIVGNANISNELSLKNFEGWLDGLGNELEATYGPSEILCRVQFCQACFKHLRGKYDEALELSNKVFKTSKMFGYKLDNHLADLAFMQYDSGDKYNAFENFKFGYDFKKDDILAKYRWMSLDERSAYTYKQILWIYNIVHYAAITPEDNRYAELAFDAMLFSKGLLLNSSLALNKLIQEEGNSEILSIFNQWQKLNHQLQLSENNPDQLTDDLRGEVNALEKRLVAESKNFGDYTNGLTVTYDQVQQAIADGDVAIEFCSFQTDIFHRQYGALILTKEMSPIYVDMGSDADWEEFGLDGQCYKSEGLFNQLFANLLKYLPLKNEGNIYFAPEGRLHTIAIENLPGASKYNWRRLSSTRELVIAPNKEEKVSNMALFGGINYGMGEVAEFYPASVSGKRESDAFLMDLPGTKSEAENIHKLLSDRISVELHTGDEASKTCLMSYSGKKTNIMHIATHGFFNPPTSQDEMINPLKNSGLYFAGAQNILYELDTDILQDNGCLTALEISSLDLRNLKLAVLSACETGLGQIGMDGVFGLQRGFKQAGTKSILMSLWKVDDEATGILMNEFYKSIDECDNLYTALEQARDKVKQQYPDPKYWAAFIIIDANYKFQY